MRKDKSLETSRDVEEGVIVQGLEQQVKSCLVSVNVLSSLLEGMGENTIKGALLGDMLQTLLDRAADNLADIVYLIEERLGSKIEVLSRPGCCPDLLDARLTPINEEVRSS